MTGFPNGQSTMAGAIPSWIGDPATGYYIKPNSDGSIPTSPSATALTGVKGADGTTIATTINGLPVLPEGVQYETVSASSTAQVMGGTGAIGDYLAGVLIIPATAAAGAVSILDNATSITIFAGGGTTALPSLVPFLVPLGIKSVSGAWKITTGTNVSDIGIGQFT